MLELEGSLVVSGISKLSQTVGLFQTLAPLMGESLEGVEGLGAILGEDIDVRFV
ncbi:MAG: hypothetical protein H5T84_01925, partial [Thermoleophilia bacterium]|nr:hypothetical protein [Thermoleophilia bacterium]